MENQRYVGLPQIERLLQSGEVQMWFPLLSRPLVARVASEVVAKERARIAGGADGGGTSKIAEKINTECERLYQKRLRPVINGTGVVIHTNMGRAPIPVEVWKASERVTTGHSNLELDLSTGTRGGRSGIIPELLQSLVGCEASLMVNNCAAAIYLLLIGLAAGRQVIVSRGEQVQIGGGFRIPEILEASGAHLVEVGTTNITTVDDYARAVNDETAMVLIVHHSNFSIQGFAARPRVAEIKSSLPPHVILAVDQGSGVTTENIPAEIRVTKYLKAGVDLVCFSGDKVLGGPQAGFIVGRAALIDPLRRHPVARVLRTGKTISSLMEDYLIRKVGGKTTGRAAEVIGFSLEELKRRGKAIKRGLGNRVKLVSTAATIGGGSAPGECFPSVALELQGEESAHVFLKRLREWAPPIIGIIAAGRARLDLSTIANTEMKSVVAALVSIYGRGQ